MILQSSDQYLWMLMLAPRNLDVILLKIGLELYLSGTLSQNKMLWTIFTTEKADWIHSSTQRCFICAAVSIKLWSNSPSFSAVSGAIHGQWMKKTARWYWQKMCSAWYRCPRSSILCKTPGLYISLRGDGSLFIHFFRSWQLLRRPCWRSRAELALPSAQGLYCSRKTECKSSAKLQSTASISSSLLMERYGMIQSKSNICGWWLPLVRSQEGRPVKMKIARHNNQGMCNYWRKVLPLNDSYTFRTLKKYENVYTF